MQIRECLWLLLLVFLCIRAFGYTSEQSAQLHASSWEGHQGGPSGILCSTCSHSHVSLRPSPNQRDLWPQFHFSELVSIKKKMAKHYLLLPLLLFNERRDSILTFLISPQTIYGKGWKLGYRHRALRVSCLPPLLSGTTQPISWFNSFSLTLKFTFKVTTVTEWRSHQPEGGGGRGGTKSSKGKLRY